MTLKIVKIRAKPGLSASGDYVLVELSLSNGRRVWGHANQLPDVAAIEVIAEQITPILQDQSVDLYQTLIAEIDALEQSVPITRIIKPVPDSSASGVTLSRRRIITGLLAEDKPESETRIEKRALHPALRFAISQALVKALAVSENKSELSILSEMVAQPLTAVPVPFLVEANETNIAMVQPLFASVVAAVGYSTGSVNAKQLLGTNAERLQAYVRKIKDWLTAAAPDNHPAIHLNIQGGFSELYENNEGKILGALYGLEQAARPYPLVVENVVKGDVTAVSQILQTLRSYLKTRQMKTQLAVGYSLFAAEALQTLVSATAVQQIHFAPAQFGSISQTISFIQACKKMGIAVIVHGEGDGMETAVAIALATQAEVLSGPPDKLYNEMIKLID